MDTKNSKMSIGHKIIVFTLILLVVPVIIGGVFSVVGAKMAIEADIQDQLGVQVQLLKNDIDVAYKLTPDMPKSEIESDLVNSFKDSVRSVVVGKTGYIYVMDSTGNMIIHPDREGDNLYQFGFIEEMCSNKEGRVSYEWEGHSAKAVYTYYEPLDWIIVSEMRLNDYLVPLYRIIYGMGVAGLGFAVFGLFIGRWFSKSITVPLGEMINVTNAVAKGDLSVDVTTAYRGEMGNLAHAIKEMVANLKDQNEKTDGMLKGIVDPMFVTDNDLVITYFNKAAEEVTGYRADEVIGKMKCAEVIRSPFCGTTGCTIKSCMASKDVIQGAESTIKNRDGKVIPISVSCAGIFDAEGNPIGGIEIARDITAEKDAKEKTEGMLKGIVDPMFVADENLVITYFNTAAEKATGYRADEVIGKMKCSEVIKSPLCNTANCAIKSCMATKDVIQGAETTITNRDGRVMPISVSCAGIFDAEGNPIGGIEVATDISDVKNVVNEIIRVADDAKDGDLSARADVEAEGDYKRLVDGINDLIDGVVVPINDIKRVVGAVADGDLTKSIEVETRGDLREFADTVELMQQNLRDLVGEIQENSATVGAMSNIMSASSEEVSASSTQIADTIGEISKGAQSQSIKTEEVSRAMNDMTQGVQEVATNAQKAAEGASEANGLAQNVGETAQGLVQTMGKIKSSIDQSASVVNELDDKSKKIGEIVSLITSVADQTNLLALNAAIEAARAGEHGRGFAVVADEVRKLAEESGTAASQIANLIGEIQEGTTGAVTSMEESINETDTGVIALESAIDPINAVVTGVNNVTSMVQDIAAVAEEQSASIEEVTSSVEEVSAISEESAAGTEEASAAVQEQTASMEELSESAQELSAMAETLQLAASRFSLNSLEGKPRCWDVKNCGNEVRQKCTAYMAPEARCWLLEGTWCGGVEQGDAKSKIHNCMNCEVFRRYSSST